MLGNIHELWDSFVNNLEQDIHQKITYQSISPSIFGTFDIKKISLYHKDNYNPDAQPFVFIERLQIKYSLFDLLKKDPLHSISSIRIDKPVINLNYNDELKTLLKNYSKDKNAAETKTPAAGNNDTLNIIEKAREYIKILPDNFNIRINKGALTVISNNTTITVHSFSLNSYINEKNLILKAGWNAEFLAEFSDKPFTVIVPGSADGVFNFETIRGDFNLFFPELSTEIFKFKKTRLIAVWTQKKLAVRKIDDKLPYDISFFMNFDASEYYAKFSATNFSPSEIITLNGNYAEYNEFLAAQFAGSVVLEKSKSSGISYSINFSGRFPEKIRENAVFLETDINGTGKGIYFDKLKLSIGRGDLSWKGSIMFDPFIPNGMLVLNNFYFTKEADIKTSTPVTGAIQISSDAAGINVYSPKIDMADTSLANINAYGLRKKQNWIISFAASRIYGVDSDEQNTGFIEAQADIDTNDAMFSFNIAVDSVKLNDLLNLTGTALEFPRQTIIATGIPQDISITTEAHIQIDYNHISYKIPHLTALYSGFSDITLTSKISGSENKFELSECHITYNDGIDMTASADYSDPQNVHFSLQYSLKNELYLTSGKFTDKKELSIITNYGFNTNVSFEKSGNAKGVITAKSMVLPFITDSPLLNMNADFNYRSKNDWNVNLENVDIKTSNADLQNILLHISGIINQDKLQLSDVVINGDSDPLSGEMLLSFKRHNIPKDAGFMPEIYINMNSRNGKETFVSEGKYNNNLFYMYINAYNFKLNRFIKDSSSLILTGKFNLSVNNIDSFSSSFNIDSINGYIGDNSFDMSAEGALNNEKIEIGESYFGYNDMNFRIYYINIDRIRGYAEAAAEIFDSPEKNNILAQFTTTANYADTESWLKISDALKDFYGNINVTKMYFSENTAEDEFSFDFSKQGGSIKISGGPSNMLDSEIDLEGEFYVKLAAPSPVQGMAVGSINNNNINASASNLFVDLKKLEKIFPSNSIITTTGGAIIADITVSGDLDNPVFYGIAQAYGVKVKLPDFITEEIGPTPVTIHLTGEDIFFDPILTPVGSGEAYVTGSFQFNRWIPNNFELAISVPDNKPILYHINIFPVISYGLADGNLKLSMDDGSFLIQGDLNCNDSIINVNDLSKEEENQDELSSDVVIMADITITAQKKVEFIWPNESYPILRTNIESQNKIKILSNSLTKSFSITGDINMRGGELFYVQRSFYIKQGSLKFRENELNFDPHITVVAEIRDRNNNGPVKISIIINDQPLTSFTAQIVSEPALSQIEIFSILGNTLTGAPEEKGSTIQKALLPALTDALAQFFLVRRLERNVRDALHLDMFSARTQLIQNLFLSSLLMTNSEEENININNADDEKNTAVGNRIGAYFDNSALFAGKYLTPDMFVQAMIFTRYDENKTDMYGLSFEADVGIELVGPVFNIRWDINPQHKNTLWVVDNRITLQRTWRLP
jgi:hypothetical protein